MEVLQAHVVARPAIDELANDCEGSPTLANPQSVYSDTELSRSSTTDAAVFLSTDPVLGVPEASTVKVPYRLKVVGLPDGYGEDQLRNLFSLAGQVVEARVVHDKASGRAVGYGYVSFGSKEAADLAISTFDDQLQLPGAANNLSVYYAKKQHDQLQDRESCPARNAKLYFCGTPSGFRRDSILALFSAFGRVRHLQVYTDSFGVLSSGTVTMYSTEEATAAMTNLDGKVLQSGTAPLKVTWAQLSTLPRRNPAGGGPPPPMPKGFTVSYACIPITVTPSEVAALFGRFGMVLQVVPFAHRREGPAGSRGCGLVVMETEQGALDSIEALSGKYTWVGAERPLQVQAFYGAERSGPHQLPSLPEGGSNNNNQGSLGRGRYQGPANRGSSPRNNSVGLLQADEEPPPPGCAPDVFKLVLANLPNSYSQSDVQALLQPYGTVMSVFRQQGPDASGDGTATVWYANGSQAEAALNALRNTVLITQNGTRQLTVVAGSTAVRANSRQQSAGMIAGGYTVNAGNGVGIFEPGSAINGGMLPQVVYQQQTQQPVVIYQPSAPFQQAGVSVVAGQGGEGMLPMWQSRMPATTTGGVQVLAAPNGPVANANGSAFDLQQLMYVLPSSSMGQTVVVSAAAPAPAGSGQLWPLGASPNSLAAAGQQTQFAATGVNNSGSMLEQMQAASSASAMTAFMANGGPPGINLPTMSAPPGAAFTGWW